MGWENNTRGKPRFVQKLRVDGKVVSKVLGYGEAGQVAEAKLKKEKQALQEKIKWNKEFQRRLDQAEEALAEASDIYMIKNGFIKRDRHWQYVKRLNTPLTTEERQTIRRIKRKTANSKATQEVESIWGATKMNLRKFRLKNQPTMTNLEKLDSFADIILSDERRAELNELLSQNPELWRELGDATTWTRNQAMADIHPGTAQYECTRIGIEEMRKSLLADGRTGLEALAIEQVITNYIQAGTTGYHLEGLDAEKLKTEEGRFWEARHHHAQNRLFKSMLTLARLRKNRVDIYATRNRARDYEPMGNHSIDSASVR